MRLRKVPTPQTSLVLDQQTWGRLGALERRPDRAKPSELEALADQILAANPDTNTDLAERVIPLTSRQMRTRREAEVPVGEANRVVHIALAEPKKKRKAA